MTVPEYNYGFPAIAQNDDWSCAPTSTRWALHAYGRAPTEAWLEGSMLAEGVVSRNDGLLDATGRRLSAWLNEHYGEYGYRAEHDPAVTFDDVAAEAAEQRHPLVMGGRAWYHWTGVRWYDSGRIILANPAPGWKGVAQQMSREQFEYLGPWSMVRLTHPEAESGAPLPPTGPDPAPPLESFSVGQGILDAMTTHGDVPASDELFFKSQDRESWSEALAASGARYLYLPSVGRVFYYPPA